jgi:hypothetical protein
VELQNRDDFFFDEVNFLGNFASVLPGFVQLDHAGLNRGHFRTSKAAKITKMPVGMVSKAIMVASKGLLAK